MEITKISLGAEKSKIAVDKEKVEHFQSQGNYQSEGVFKIHD